PGGPGGRRVVLPGGARDLAIGRGGVALRPRPFSHADEVAEPGYYRVRLTDDGTVVEATAAPEGGVFRVSFGAGRHAVFVGDTAGERLGFSETAIGSQAVDGGRVYSFAGPSV